MIDTGMSDVEIQLSEQPNAYGFLSGMARRGDAVVRVNILPPAHIWAGDVVLDGHPPDPVHWTIYADGEIIARIERQEDVGAALVPLLTTR
jgi:hypothetical protein